MRTWNVWILILCAIYELSRWTQDMAGDPAAIKLEKESKTPRGVQDLRDELGNNLPEGVYSVFKRGVEHHRRQRYSQALQEYRKLRQIPLQDGSFYDLLQGSEIFKHNWRLLSATMKHDETI